MGKAADFLHRITANLPMRLIDIDGKPYLERYHLMALPGGRRIWLHHFVSNDSERHVHCHPWSALSVILAGGYVEVVGSDFSDPQIVCHAAPGLNWIPAAKRHRIIYAHIGTWSLMIVGPRTGRGWFFYNPDGSTEPGPSPTNPDWHKVAGCRAEVYAELNARLFVAAHTQAKTKVQ